MEKPKSKNDSYLNYVVYGYRFGYKVWNCPPLEADVCQWMSFNCSTVYELIGTLDQTTHHGRLKTILLVVREDNITHNSAVIDLHKYKKLVFEPYLNRLKTGSGHYTELIELLLTQFIKGHTKMVFNKTQNRKFTSVQFKTCYPVLYKLNLAPKAERDYKNHASIVLGAIPTTTQCVLDLQQFSVVLLSF